MRIENNDIYRRSLREKINDEDTINILNKLDIKNNINCLEIGMGLGSIANYMTKYVGHDGIVDAIDLKIENVEYVKRHVIDNRQAIHCLDIKDITKLNKKYDLVHARFVFEHIKERESTLKIIRDQMNEGGNLIIEDAVYDNIEYNGSLEFKEIIKEYVQCIKHKFEDTSYLWGKNMHIIVEQAGFKNVNSFGNIRVFRGGTIEADYWMNCFKEFQDDLTQNGVTVETLDKVYSELNNVENIFSGPAIFTVVCKK